jgi:hypothetical protein
MTSYTFDQLLDFTRTTSGTFVGSNGLIQNTPASVNLLLQTQQFDNASWTKSDATVTANTTTAPDGTTTADTLAETATTTTHFTRQSPTVTSGTTYTGSVYLKKGSGSASRDFIQLIYNAVAFGSNAYANFNIASGTVTVTGAGVTASISDAGNGWYRCSITGTAIATGSGQFFISTITSGSSAALPSYLGDVNATTFIWGAQLEADATATTYTRNNGGRFPPRFDYDPVTLAPKGILIEEQRVNLLLQSETFSTTWADFGFSLDKNYTSPSGQNTATKIVPDNATTLANNALQQDVSKSASAITYTCSIFAKAGEFNRLRLLVRDTASGANFARATFNLGTQTVSDGPTVGGTFSAASVSYQNAPNGFIRYCLTFTSGTETSIRPVLVVFDSTATTGNGTSGIFLYGAQLEAGAFATSYIPTVASQVTRTADQCAIVAPNFAPWYNQSEGTFVADFDKYSTTLRGGVLCAGNISGLSGTGITLDGQNNGKVRAFIENAGALVMDNLTLADYTANTPIKGAIAYATNNSVGAAAGALGTVDTSVAVPTVDNFQIGAVRNTTLAAVLPLNGHIRSVQYYPVRLADFQLQALSA